MATFVERIVAGFLYFCEGARGSWTDWLDSYGLGYLREPNVKLFSRQVIAGRQHAQGVILGSSSNFTAEEVRSDPSMEWYDVPVLGREAANKAWVGKMPGPMPVPSDLERRQMLTSHPLVCRDGRVWQLPVARTQTDEGYVVNVPRTYGVNPETLEFELTEVAEQYAGLWRHVQGYMDAVSKAIAEEADGFTYELESVAQFFEDVFQANYRVSRIELAWMRVVGDGMLDQVMSILFDNPSDALLEKKTDQDTGNG